MNVPLIHPTKPLNIMQDNTTTFGWYNNKNKIIDPKFVFVKLNMRWIGHKSLGSQVIMLDECELHLYVTIPSLPSR